MLAVHLDLSTRMDLEGKELTSTVIGAAIDVHRELGPGFLESVYEDSLAIEMKRRGINFQRQLPVPEKFRARARSEKR